MNFFLKMLKWIFCPLPVFTVLFHQLTVDQFICTVAQRASRLIDQHGGYHRVIAKNSISYCFNIHGQRDTTTLWLLL